MIFGSVIRRAEHAVENILDQALARVIVAIPLLIAAGFATASASAFLNARYGVEWGNLILAGVFGFIGLVAAVAVTAKSSSKPTVSEAVEPVSAFGSSGEEASGSNAPLSSSEKELMNAMLTSAAPIALPGLIRLILRNIPLVLAILAAVFVMTRSNGEASRAESSEPVAP